ncbi:MAG: FAD-dependent oxidoreductase [Candidatus Helarchaeota archaeon]
MDLKIVPLSFDCVVCGGGIGGVCAALASARKGLKTALVQNRPVLGGNASSEVRVHIGGAPHHGYHFDARETGIIEEIRLETAIKDPKNEYFWIDCVLLSKCIEEPNLSLFLNTNIYELEKKENKIISVKGIQNSTEKIFEFSAEIFIDATGDGILGYLANAEFRIGREEKTEFNESLAPNKPDTYTLGSSIMFQARDMGRPIKYIPPSWAKKFKPEDLNLRCGYKKHSNFKEYWHADSVGWWWVEYGGTLDTIKDNETIKLELQSIVYGIWDLIKNKDPTTKEIAKNFEITWISQIPGKRESRRLIGDYILTENDLISMKIFDDQIAIGGWSIDLHPPEGFYAKGPGAKHKYMDLPYSISFRCIYSKNIKNLLMASRCISVSHVAHGSTRLIATLGCIGQAAGIAAYFCVKNKYTPRDLYEKDIKFLQQELIKEDARLLGIKNKDPKDLALKARISSNSEMDVNFGNISKFVPLYFPMAQRFYLWIDPSKNKEFPKIYLFLKNEAELEEQITGGIRLDSGREEFKSKQDLVKFKAVIPPKHNNWVLIDIEDPSFAFKESGNYWIYLNENENIYWAKNEEHHWTGMRLGYYNEQLDCWQTVRINGNPFFDKVIGFFGNFCFKIEVDNDNERYFFPYPACNINNGENAPFISPNLWISKPFRKKCLKDPLTINNTSDIDANIEIYLEFQNEQKNIVFSQIWLTFDTELNNSYPHQSYGEEKIKDWPIGGKSPKCIRNMDIFMEEDKQERILIYKVKDNYQRRIKIKLEKPISTKKLIFVPKANWGFHCFSLYEIRIYK